MKLYHNMRLWELENLLLENGILDCHRKHKEGHGDELWFTSEPEAWGREAKISIVVPDEMVGRDFRNQFYKVSTNDYTYEHNVDTKKFRFKIEQIGGTTYEEFIQIYLENEDRYFRRWNHMSEFYKTDCGMVAWWFIKIAERRKYQQKRRIKNGKV